MAPVLQGGPLRGGLEAGKQLRFYLSCILYLPWFKSPVHVIVPLPILLTYALTHTHTRHLLKDGLLRWNDITHEAILRYFGR